MDLLSQALAREAEHSEEAIPELDATSDGEAFVCIACHRTQTEPASPGSAVCRECADDAGVQNE